MTDYGQSVDQQIATFNAPKERRLTAIGSLIFALPFPILIIVLWATVSSLKGSAALTGPAAMTAVILYFLQFFLVPLFTVTSIILACIAITKSKTSAKKIAYVSLALSASGFILLALFLNIAAT